MVTARRFAGGATAAAVERVALLALPLIAAALLVTPCRGADFGEDVDFYQVLGIPRDAPQQEVKRSYRKLSLQYHPDKVDKTGEVSPEEAAEKFRQIAAAYAALNDRSSREFYDYYGHDYADVKDYFDTVVRMSGTDELFGKSKGITILFGKNCENLLANSKQTWVVLFYHPGCGSCRTAASWFKNFAAEVDRGYKSVLRVGTINCEVMMGLCHELDFDHMGQIRIFPRGQAKGAWYSIAYEGAPLPKHLLPYALSINPLPKLRQLENDRQMESLLSRVTSSPSTREDAMKPLHSVGVVFYQKPTCPPCRALKQQLPSLLSEIGDVLEIATIDCTVHACNAPYYPYLKMFYKTIDSSEIRSFPLHYEGNMHPGAIALRAAAQVLREVSGFRWSEQDKEALKAAEEL